MKLYGEFKNVDNETIKVVIISDGDTSTEVEITKANGIMFGENPVVIETNVPEMTDVYIKKTCKINLLCTNYLISPLFANNAHSVIVNVTKGNDCIFAGYVEPNIYSQGYANPLETIEVNCTDALTTLQYYNYKNIIESTYDTARNQMSIVSFTNILQGALASVISDLNISTITHTPTIHYDMSKVLGPRSTVPVLNNLTISERVFLGEKYDDIKTYEEVVEDILRYLNLHIEQIGWDFYIFDWSTRKNGRGTWYDMSNSQSEPARVIALHTLNSSNHSDSSTNITVDTVYNQFKVSCEMEEMDVMIDSPFDKDNLYSPYTQKQLCFRQYYADSTRNMYDMLRGTALENSDKCKFVDWYMRPLLNKHWTFYVGGGADVSSFMPTENGKYINMWNVPYQLKYHQIATGMLSFGSIEKNANLKDNTIKGKISMSDYLYVTCHGTHGQMQDHNDEIPTEDTIRQMSPIMEFTGGGSGVYSPGSSDITNYLVISGKILLQRYAPRLTGAYSAMQTFADSGNYEQFYSTYNNSYEYEDEYTSGDDHKYWYTLKGFKMKNPEDAVDESLYLTTFTSEPPAYPFSSKQKQFKYMSPSPPRFEDKMMKIPILECELIIGTKRLIEQDLDEYGNSILKWVTIGQEPTYTDPDTQETYTLTTFTIGFNPATDDYIVGQEYSITNTCKPEYNLDVEGTAIPIKKSDNLSGAVIFRILGPVNCSYNKVNKDVHRRFLFWRKTNWTTNVEMILPYVENIIVKDFKINLTTTNSGETVYDEQELVYMSEELDTYINKNEDITFNLITQPTPEQCEEKKIQNKQYMNSVTTDTGSLVQKIHSNIKTQAVVPEQDYVNDYYSLYSTPKVLLETTVHNASVFDHWNRFRSTPLNRNFYPIAIDEDVYMNTKKLTLRQT